MSHKSSKIGYALGGGAARGLSHIGVLKVLEEYGIYPDIIAGTSMGAVIGALYADGFNASEIEQLVSQLDWKRLVLLTDITLPVSGLFQGRRVISLLKSILGDSTFSQLKCDFASVAADIMTGEQVVLHDGSLVEAIRASISLPGIFSPVRINGRYLVDGGLVNVVPVSVCRERGAEYVIGVNVIPEPSNSREGRTVHAREIPKLNTSGDEIELSTSSNAYGRHLRLRLDSIDNAIKTFLLYHNPKRQGRMLRQSDSVRMDNPTKSLPKAPTLLDVLSQSVTITEYRLAIENIRGADLAISPDVEDIGFWQFNKAAQAIAAGEIAARRVLQRSKLTSILS